MENGNINQSRKCSKYLGLINVVYIHSRKYISSLFLQCFSCRAIQCRMKDMKYGSGDQYLFCLWNIACCKNLKLYICFLSLTTWNQASVLKKTLFLIRSKQTDAIVSGHCSVLFLNFGFWLYIMNEYLNIWLHLKENRKKNGKVFSGRNLQVLVPEAELCPKAKGYED